LRENNNNNHAGWIHRRHSEREKKRQGVENMSRTS
jgi:hypothetical protein